MKRRLTLRSETLVELTTDELNGLAGGLQAVTQGCERPTIDRCLTGYYPSLNAPCTTLLRPLDPILTGTN
jgi:hypothetical protein